MQGYKILLGSTAILLGVVAWVSLCCDDEQDELFWSSGLRCR